VKIEKMGFLNPTKIGSGSGTTKNALRYPPHKLEEDIMGFGRGALLWLIGIPLPIILLLAVFMHH
jgi:hypothetical protein